MTDRLSVRPVQISDAERLATTLRHFDRKMRLSAKISWE